MLTGSKTAETWIKEARLVATGKKVRNNLEASKKLF